MKYLDNAGLAYLWAKLKNLFALKSDTYTKDEIDTMLYDDILGGSD